MFGQWRFIAIRMGYGVSVAIIIRPIVSSPPLGVVMDQGRDILVKLEGFGESVEGQGGGGRTKEEG